MSDEYADVFKEETYEILEELERSLLDLEASPDDADLIGKIFRAIHTIKGSGAMFGFDMISTFAHEIENAFELIREGVLMADKVLIDLTLQGMDFIKQYLEVDELDEVGEQERDRIVQIFKNIVEQGADWQPDPALLRRMNVAENDPADTTTEPKTTTAAKETELPEEPEDSDTTPEPPEPEEADDPPTAHREPKTTPKTTPKPTPKPTPLVILDDEPLIHTAEPQDETPEEETNAEEAGESETSAEATPPEPEEPKPATPKEPVENTYRIRFKPAADIMKKGTEISALLKEVHGLGECHIVAHLNDIPPLEEMFPYDCYTSWDIILTSTHSRNAIHDVFIFVEDDADISIENIDDGDAHEPAEYKKVGNILVEKGEVAPEEINSLVNAKKRIGEMLLEVGMIEPESLESALVEQQHVRELRKRRQETETASSLRVASEKVDLLVNLVGELVTLQARLAQISHQRNDPELISLSEEVERITWELRDNSMDMRMLPIGSTFSRFKRLVRDLSNNLGKEVELTTEGGDTELDKTVIEKLNDPLVHIIRNSIDHGIEAPDIRMASGKPKKGSVKLMAYHSGYNVVIRITDDGAGLDTERIRHKAIERGIIAPDKELTDNEIFHLIFEPGFSTAAVVSDVSGRGVGMDVVKRNIEALRGFIEIDSKKGQGTVFTLRIPLTLAIIDGLLVEIGQEKFVIPLSLVESCIEVPHQQIATAERQYVNVRGELIPYIYLKEEFGVVFKPPEMEQIVITIIENTRVGFVVDHVVGDHQTVIKSLGRVYKHVEGISGATILGDGTVALILDVSKLVQKAVADAENLAIATKTAAADII